MTSQHPATAATDEYHYAPIAGNIVKMRGDAIVAPATDSGWPGFHQLLDEFLKLSSDGKLELVETISYGHRLFHGHRGRVDVYRRIQGAPQ